MGTECADQRLSHCVPAQQIHVSQMHIIKTVPYAQHFIMHLFVGSCSVFIIISFNSFECCFKNILNNLQGLRL